MSSTNDVGRAAVLAEKVSLASATSIDDLCPVESGLGELEALADALRCASQTEVVADDTAPRLAELITKKIKLLTWCYKLEVGALRERIAELESMVAVPAAGKKKPATKKARRA